MLAFLSKMKDFIRFNYKRNKENNFLLFFNKIKRIEKGKQDKSYIKWLGFVEIRNRKTFSSTDWKHIIKTILNDHKSSWYSSEKSSEN